MGEESKDTVKDTKSKDESNEATLQQLHSDGLQAFISNPAKRIREAYWHPNSPSEFTYEEMMVRYHLEFE